MSRTIGYLRVSTDAQSVARQQDGLEEMCDELRIEHGVSATAKKRPVFDALVAELTAGDTLVVWSLDRAFRSSRDALNVSADLRARGIDLRIVSLCIDTTTPEGKLFFTIMAALAEFERDTLSQRTKEGMEAARKRGVRLGRPRVTALPLAA